MTGVEHTVLTLIARFTLRRHASSAEFLAGVFLVQQGAVYVRGVSARMLNAIVRDGAPHSVSILVEGNDLVGDCSCGSRREQVCRHQVAAVHAVWLQHRY